jgi:hypothetical protein
VENLKNNQIEETKQQEIKTVDDLLEKIKDEEEIGVDILDELSASRVSAGYSATLSGPKDDVGH